MPNGSDAKYDICPCCGYDSLYEWCSICYWEEDTVCERFPDWEHCANWHSLREAQELFELFGFCDGPHELWATKPLVERTSEFERSSAWQPLAPPFRGPSTDPDLLLNDATCPCCGFVTINAGENWCAICGWTYCSQQQSPDFRCMPNRISLRNAQYNYERYGAISEAWLPYFRKPQESDSRDPAWQPLEWHKEVSAFVPYVVHDTPRTADLTCPCCGYKSIPIHTSICPICLWRYYLGHRDAYDASKPNSVTLRQAQENYRSMGAFRELPTHEFPFASPPRKPTQEDVRDPMWQSLD